MRLPMVPMNHYLRIEEKAHKNVDKWGLQDMDTLLLCIMEEVGELTQAHLQARAEGGDPGEVLRELRDLQALLIQVWWQHPREDYGEENEK